MTATADRILAALAEELRVAPGALSRDARFVEDFGVDSLDFVRVVMAAEEAGGVRLDDKAAALVRTVGELLDLAAISPPPED